MAGLGELNRIRIRHAPLCVSYSAPRLIRRILNHPTRGIRSRPGVPLVFSVCRLDCGVQPPSHGFVLATPPRLEFGTKLAGAWQYDFNLGYKYRGAWNADGTDKYTSGAGIRYKINSKWQLLSEMVTELQDKAGAYAKALVDAAIKYTVREGLKVDFLVGTGLGCDAIELRLVSGIKWEF